MSKAIAVMNQKGGVGKTTTTVNLGAALSEKSYKVLLIDLDPAGNMTQWLAGEYSKDQAGLAELLGGKSSFSEIVKSSDMLGLDFIPSGNNLGAMTTEINVSVYLLKDKLEHFSVDYDFILIDCPPSSDILIGNALMAAESLIIPIQTETLPLQAGIRFLDWLEDFTRRNGNSINILGILPCMFDVRTRLSRVILETMKESRHIGPLVFDTIIRKNVRLAELSGQEKSIFKSASTSHGANDYADLADEVIERAGAGAPIAVRQGIEPLSDEVLDGDSATVDSTDGTGEELVYQESGSVDCGTVEKEEDD